MLPVAIDGHAVAHDAPVHQSDGADPLGQSGQHFGGEVLGPDSCLGRRLGFQRLAAHEVALGLIEGDGELGESQGEDGHGLALLVYAHLVAVEGQHALHAQGVPGAEAGRLSAQLQQTVPGPQGVLVLQEQLIADGLGGVAGPGNLDGVALQIHGGQVVAGRLGDLRAAGQDGEHLAALGALDRDGNGLGGDVADGAVVVLHDGGEIGQILVRVGGVHHQQEAIRLKLIEIRVVHGAAVLSGDDAVLGLVEIQSQDVAAEHVLQERHPIWPLDKETSHMAHVKKAAAGTGVQMLGDDAFRILDGHLPAAEIHHGGARRDVGVIELGSFKLAHENPPIVIVSYMKCASRAGEQKRRILLQGAYCASVSCLRDSRRGAFRRSVAPSA